MNHRLLKNHYAFWYIWHNKYDQIMNKLCWYIYIAIRSPWYSYFVSYFEGSWTAVSSEIQDETFPPFGTLQPDVLTPLMFIQRIEPVKLRFKRRRNISVICSRIYKYKQRLITVHFWISVTGQFKPILITLWTSCLFERVGDNLDSITY